MARTSDEIEQEISELRRAYATGARRVSYDGRTVEYDSANGLLNRIADLEEEQAKLVGGVRRKSVAAYVKYRRPSS